MENPAGRFDGGAQSEYSSPKMGKPRFVDRAGSYFYATKKEELLPVPALPLKTAALKIVEALFEGNPIPVILVCI